MDSNENKNQKTNQTLFFLLSISIHIFLTTLVFLAEKITPPVKQNIEVTYVQPADIKSTVPETAKLEKFEDVKDKKQIVDQNKKALNDEIDPKTKYLSQNNQKVLKQTMAQNRGEFRNGNGVSQNPSITPEVQARPISKTKVSKADVAKSKTVADENKTENTTSKRISMADLAPKMDFEGMYQRHMQSEKEKEQQLVKQAAANQQEQQARNAEKQSVKSQGLASQTLDYIKDIDPGLETLLSTREFIYYTFYNRIRNQLNQHWGPMVRERLTKLFSEGRNIASTDDKVTKILVTLDNKGTLIKVQVIGDSGVRDLDEAAVDAFKKAAPFPNPPRGIVDPDGTIKIRWDFILEA